MANNNDENKIVDQPAQIEERVSVIDLNVIKEIVAMVESHGFGHFEFENEHLKLKLGKDFPEAEETESFSLIGKYFIYFSTDVPALGNIHHKGQIVAKAGSDTCIAKVDKYSGKDYSGSVLFGIYELSGAVFFDTLEEITRELERLQEGNSTGKDLECPSLVALPKRGTVLDF